MDEIPFDRATNELNLQQHPAEFADDDAADLMLEGMLFNAKAAGSADYDDDFFAKIGGSSGPKVEEGAGGAPPPATTTTSSGAPATSAPCSNGNNNHNDDDGNNNSNNNNAHASKIIPTSSVTPTDVLLGRGNITHQGNVAFRLVVERRKEEYLRTPNNKVKNRIAREVVDCVRTEFDPPGRFLRRATERDLAELAEEVGEEEAGGSGSDSAFIRNGIQEELWVEAEEKAVTEKAKQSLREKHVHKKLPQAATTAATVAATPTAAAAVAATSSNGQGPVEASAPNVNGAPPPHHPAAVFAAGGGNGGGVASSGAPEAAPPPCYENSVAANGAGDDVIRTLQRKTSPVISGTAAATMAPRDRRLAEELPSSCATDGAAAWEPEPIPEPAAAPGLLATVEAVLPLPQQQASDPSPAPLSGEPAPAMANADDDELLAGGSLSSILSSSSASAHAAASSSDLLGATQAPAAVTLRNWIQTNISSSSSASASASSTYLISSVLLAHKIVTAVRDAHASGTACGPAGLGVDGILVPGGGHASTLAGGAVWVTGFGSVAARGGRFDGRAVGADLRLLGEALYELFSGCGPFDSSETEEGAVAADESNGGSTSDSSPDGPSKKKKGGDSSSSVVPLRDLGLPVLLDVLVSNLLDAEDETSPDRYRTAEEAAGDVALMVSNPDRYLFGNNGVGGFVDGGNDGTASISTATSEGGGGGTDSSNSKLPFPVGRLYGRDGDVAHLEAAYDRVVGRGGPIEVVLVSGPSGTGKSSLVEQVRGPIVERGGYFISGKFDQLLRTQPLLAIVSALDSYCRELAERDADREIRSAIRDAVGTQGEVLTALMPNLGGVVGEFPRASPVQVGGVEALHRLAFFFRMFVRAISRPSHPVVLFLDDLQWADVASLELIKMLVTDGETSSLLFVGCYRDSEVGASHPLTAQLGHISVAGVTITNIKLGDMDGESVNALVSDTVGLFPRLTLPLTAIVLRKTGGNALFVVQFLSSLVDEGLLRYSAVSRRWEWDEAGIRRKDIADNVVDLMKGRMLRLNPWVQFGLKMAACLGARWDASTLELLTEDATGGALSTAELLRVVEEEGLVCKDGGPASSFKFSHDQIQKAAYSLTPEANRPALHLEIGRILRQKIRGPELDGAVFVVVEQLNRGSHLITESSERVELARMNLMAGQRATSSWSFLAASIYLKVGIALMVQEDGWENHYDMCLEMYNLCIEAQLVVGLLDEMSVLLDQVFARARVFKDKRRAYFVLVKTLGAKANFSEGGAIDTGFSILEQLGESFPAVVDMSVTMQDLALTMGMLAAQDEKSLSEERFMKDEQKLAAMELLRIIMLYAYAGDQEKLPLLTFRMVQLSLSHGFSKESAFGFSCFAIILCSVVGDIEGGYKMGKVALSLLEKFNAQDLIARVYAGLYGACNIWTEPIQACLPQYLVGRDAGLKSGDPEYAMICANIYVCFAFQCGQPLETLVEETSMFRREMVEYSQDYSIAHTLAVWQGALNLMGKSEDPVTLTGEVMDQESFLFDNLEKRNLSATCLAYLVRLYLAYLFGRYELAAEMADKSRDIDKMLTGRWEKCTHALYDCLTALAMARTCSENKKWRDIADKAIESMQIWSKSSSWNCEHRLELMKAERYFLTGDVTEAAGSYDKAIALAGEHGFTNDQALALERAGMLYLDKGDQATSREYYKRSRNCYIKWGALGKAEDIEGFCL